MPIGTQSLALPVAIFVAPAILALPAIVVSVTQALKHAVWPAVVPLMAFLPESPADAMPRIGVMDCKKAQPRIPWGTAAVSAVVSWPAISERASALHPSLDRILGIVIPRRGRVAGRDQTVDQRLILRPQPHR
jgi:hypothetical protein